MKRVGKTKEGSRKDDGGKREGGLGWMGHASSGTRLEHFLEHWKGMGRGILGVLDPVPVYSRWKCVKTFWFSSFRKKKTFVVNFSISFFRKAFFPIDDP